ncbi:MAG: two-component sensor histidine kinase [Agathobacter sp.]|nr:two-component sensor histidine kinase [Agathobacter sp.]MBQ6811894.1 two-component sensor histidine kinase [Agathobacter sp.]
MEKTSNFMSFIKSLKCRLTVFAVIIAVIPGLVVGIGILFSYEQRAVSLRESEVLSQARILSNQVATSNYIDGTSSSETLLAQMSMLTNIYDGRILVVDDNFEILYDTYNLDNNRTIISEEVIRSFKGEEMTSYDSENRYLEMSIPITNPNDETGTILGVLVVSISTDNIALNLSYLTQIATVIVILVILVVGFIAVMSSIRIVAPLTKLSDGIASVQGGISDRDLMVNDYTETIIICEKFNEMMRKIRVMDESRQEFVSNVSHELKTPLTSMKVLADSLNSMPDAPVELYKEFMGDITNEIERETQIINDLLSLVKMDKTGATLNITTVNVNDLLEQIMKRLQPIADKQKVQLVLESFRPVSAELDEVKITLAITNLIENGIKYNKDDGEGWVHVSLNADHQYFYLKVEDSGMGIPEDAIEHIYERFYRVDKSHSREIGGTGLGLAITRNSILMHKGVIKVHSELGEGTTFDVRIPLSYIA